ncbi:MAG: Sau3AI family type II restriction endonuclease, partial [Fusobacteriaceae bacterium]
MLFDKKCQKSIEKYGKKLEGNSLREFDIQKISKASDKGGFNKIVEENYFKIDNNSLQIADFSEAGVELKVTPLKEVKKKKESIYLREVKGLSMKERTVLTMIDYYKLSKESWENNTLKEKAFKILFCFYIWKKDTANLDYIFDLVSLWEPNKRDLEIIEQDWNIIVNKIKLGKAHEISEGDTLYLGACTKGANANSKRIQPFSDELAKQRAFSFKRSYMDMVYEELLQKKTINLTSIKKKEETLEETLKNIFKPFIGKTAYEIEQNFEMSVDIEKDNLPKQYYSMLSNKILGIDVEKIEEFKKAGIKLKTIRIDETEMPLEHISFPTFKFIELANEKEWSESELCNYLVENKFFFTVYEITTKNKREFNKLDIFEKRKHLKLKKIKIWGISALGLDKMEELWIETKKVIAEGLVIEKKGMKNFNNLPGKNFNKVGHVRPHAKNNSDTYFLPDGRKMPKQSFW